MAKRFPIVTDDSGKRTQYRSQCGRCSSNQLSNKYDDDHNEGGFGMYEVMKDIKRMCNLLWMQKVVHMCRMGVHHAQVQHGALEPEIDLLGGGQWTEPTLMLVRIAAASTIYGT